MTFLEPRLRREWEKTERKSILVRVGRRWRTGNKRDSRYGSRDRFHAAAPAAAAASEEGILLGWWWWWCWCWWRWRSRR